MKYYPYRPDASGLLTNKTRKMKYILPLIAALVLISCKTLEVTQYEYRSTTMLGTRTITVTKDSVVTQYTGRLESTYKARATTPEEWTKLKESVEGVKMEDIADLKSPTNKRSTDASPYGTISFTTKDSTYRSASFDGFDSHDMLQPTLDVIKEIAHSLRQ